MRVKGLRAVALALALALAVAGCNLMTEAGYHREGIGTNLTPSDLTQETLRLDEYVADICRQGEIPSCPPPTGSPYWALFVQAGMNDIDRRCDGFLAYVDYLKRSKDHWIKQFGDTLTAANTIVGATHQSDKPLKILSAAFGLATDTFSNMNGRLLSLADQATIQTVVLSGQNEFRRSIVKQPINNKPAALYALRSYLRLCMPFTIETKINSTVTIYEQAGTEALRQTEAKPLVDASLVGAAALTPREPIKKPPRSTPTPMPAYADLFDPYNQQVVSKTYATGVLQALCASEAEITAVNQGSVPDLTKARIAIFESTYDRTRATPTRRNGKLDTDEAKELRGLGSCVPSGGRNYYERTTFADTPAGAEAVAVLIKALKKTPGGAQLPDATTLEGARGAIRAARNDPAIRPKLKLNLPADLQDEVTRDLVLALPR